MCQKRRVCIVGVNQRAFDLMKSVSAAPTDVHASWTKALTLTLPVLFCSTFSGCMVLVLLG